jgi:hypothetical protein
MIPSAYKANKVYSVLPTNGDADLDFVRTSTRTRVNQIGLIEDLATGVPALDYSDGGCPTLLLEPQSTNLITYSEDFDNSAWNKGNTTISANSLTSPKGDLTADKLVENATTNTHFILETGGTVSSIETFSVFAKANGRNWILLQSGGNSISSFDLSNGVIGSNQNCTPKIEDYGSGWYRCSISFTRTVNTNNIIGLLQSDSSSLTSYLGDGTSGVYIWGAQVEEQSYATSYIPTSGATATRVAETLSKTGLSSYINDNEGVLYIEFASFKGDNQVSQFSISNGTDNETVKIIKLNENTVRFELKTLSGANFSYDTSVDVSSNNKYALQYKPNDYKVFLNGVKQSIVQASVVPSGLSRIGFDRGDGGDKVYAKVKDLRVYNQALTDTELQNLTS